MNPRHRVVALTATLLLALPGCSTFDGPQLAREADAGSEGSPPTQSTETESPSGPTPGETSEGSQTPDGSGTPDGDPAVLDWQPVPGSTEQEATVSGAWTLVVPPGGGGAALTGPERRSVPVPPDYRVVRALADGTYAVVVAEHVRSEKPDVAKVVDLASGGVRTLDARSEVPTTVGGSWALGSGLLVHATAPGRDYCLAAVDLASGRSSRGPCVPPRHGISNVRVTPAGVTAMTFDDGRPSCRTLNRVEGETFVPLDGVEECRGWEAVTTETAAVWGTVPNERRVEESQFFADVGDGPLALGPGTSGTLTWCGSSAYFVRDPQRDDEPARLVRVTPAGEAEVVYESPGAGNAFLAAPRCGGGDLTVSAFSAAGDEQVTARVG